MSSIKKTQLIHLLAPFFVHVATVKAILIQLVDMHLTLIMVLCDDSLSLFSEMARMAQNQPVATILK